MYLVKVTVRKRKGSHDSAVECPSFFREADSIEEVKEYVDDQFRDVVSLYLEYIPDAETDEDGLPITTQGLFP